ncbi:MAG: helix-turn-helix domain-containing protein, partial [Oscillospiraceae bacterium]
IIADREKGIPVEEIHKVLGVSIPAIYDIVRKYKERGTLEGNYSGRPAQLQNRSYLTEIGFLP